MSEYNFMAISDQMGCLHQGKIKHRSLTWYTAHSLCPLSQRWGCIEVSGDCWSGAPGKKSSFKTSRIINVFGISRWEFGQCHYILKFYNQDNINEWWAMVHGSSMAKQLPSILCQYQLNGDNNEPIYRGRCNRYNKKQVILRNWDTFAEGAAIRWAGRQAIFLQGNLWLVTIHWLTGCW